MPNNKTVRRSNQKAKKGNRPTTQAGEFVREEIEDIRKGKHGARSTKQAIAIGLSKARRSGAKLPPPPGKSAAGGSRKTANGSHAEPSPTRSRATLKALQREPRSSVSTPALSRQTRRSAAARGPEKRHESAMKAVHTKGRAGLRAAARKPADTRARQGH